jgi:alcohol dehydrogenase class IV
MENLLPLLKSLKGIGVRPGKKAARHHMACLTQASVITGVILANCRHLLGFRLGRIVADHCSATPAQASAILLPAILEFFAGSTPALGRLALPLTDLSTFSQTPGPQRPALAIHKIQTLVNDLYMISLGAVPRTLKDAGMDRTAIDALVESQFFNAEEPEKGSVKMDPEQAQVILVRAFEGRPMNQA